jgi:hypothetical protein
MENQRSVFVSHISHNSEASGETDIGAIIINYLIDTKTPANANIVIVGGSLKLFSLYNHDLRNTVSSLGVSRVIIGKDKFINELDKGEALNNLKNYLEYLRSEAIDGDLPFEEENLLEEVMGYLFRIKPYFVGKGPGQENVVEEFIQYSSPRESIREKISISNETRDNRVYGVRNHVAGRRSFY